MVRSIVEDGAIRAAGGTGRHGEVDDHFVLLGIAGGEEVATLWFVGGARSIVISVESMCRAAWCRYIVLSVVDSFVRLAVHDTKQMLLHIYSRNSLKRKWATASGNFVFVRPV